MINDQAKNKSVSSKIERVQYDSSLAIAGAVTGTSQEKLFQELVLESLRTRKKIFKVHVQTNYNSKAIISFQSDTSNLGEWNELSSEICNSTFYQQFSPPNIASKQIDEFLFPLKSSGNLWSFDDFR